MQVYFDLKQTSNIIGVGENKLRQEIKDNNLDAMLIGNKYVLTEEAIMEYMNSKRRLKSKAGRPKNKSRS